MLVLDVLSSADVVSLVRSMDFGFSASDDDDDELEEDEDVRFLD